MLCPKFRNFTIWEDLIFTQFFNLLLILTAAHLTDVNRCKQLCA